MCAGWGTGLTGEMRQGRSSCGGWWRAAAAVGLAALAAAVWAAQPGQDIERQLEAAIHSEMVVGDLKGAVEQYRAIVEDAGKDRAAAARALFQMGQCLEKLGQRKEAHAVYSRLAAEYGDQGEMAGRARAKLLGWTDALPGPRNLRFEEGEPGEVPSGWFVPSVTTGAERLAEVRRKGCRSGVGCAVVLAPGDGTNSIGNLMQSFSAAAYRGKTVRLRAWLRLESSSPADRAQMWFRVDRMNGQNGFFDNMDDRPVQSAQWTSCEIASQIDGDAQFLDFGVSAIGKGRVWVDDVSFDVVPPSEVASAREAVQRLYGRLDSVVLPEAQYRAYAGASPLREALRRGAMLDSENAVTAFRLAGTGAVATVRSEFNMTSDGGEESGVNTFRDTWVRTGEGWRLRERTFLTGHFVAPPTDAETSGMVAADLKQLAAPLATCEAGHMFYDLAPFGNAIGEARVVALGQAAEGTREFAQMKHRLLEYLVKEKGFTVLAIVGRRAEAAAIDRYIKTGEGDVKAALAAMDWAWDTREGLELIEWMHAYNQALVPHLTLSFASFDADAVANEQDHPGEKIVLWANNDEVSRQQGMGTRLREKFNGSRLYTVGFALHRGELRAAGFKNGYATGVASHTIAGLPGGMGDAVLSGAGMPTFFLEMRAVAPLTTLGRWLAESHLFLAVKGSWNQDDPASQLEPEVLARTYDGLIFVEESHAARVLDANRGAIQ